MNKRCGFCGELWHSDIAAGEQYKCGTIVCGAEVKRHRYCMRLCGEPGHRRVKQPRMKVDNVPRPKKCVGTNSRWRGVREALRGLVLGESVHFADIAAESAQKACRYFAHELPHKIRFRSDGKQGCIASVVGDITGMQPGESRPYSRDVRQTLSRIKTLAIAVLEDEADEVYTMELVEGVFWIRRVR